MKYFLIFSIISIILISGCVKNNDANTSVKDMSLTRCETFTIYHETDPTLLPVDSVEKATRVKANLPKCPNGEYRPGCIVENKEYEIKTLDYSAYSISGYGVPITILSNGTVTWTKCVY